MFQSTHSLRSATSSSVVISDITNGFNPRTPCGVRPVVSATIATQGGVSIHALLAECDFWGLSNPLPPRSFQSTHSLRSATLFCGQSCAVGDSFNPRTPCGVRPGSGRRTFPGLLCFNPRTPCGVRQGIKTMSNQINLFQSTHSLRSATSFDVAPALEDLVSIHALLAECDQGGKWLFALSTDVSIHALLAECDLLLALNCKCSMWFQSTHSLRSATGSGVLSLVLFAVSIHALLAECDFV